MSSDRPPPVQRIRIVLADRQHLVRTGLAVIFRGYDDLEVVGEAASAS